MNEHATTHPPLFSPLNSGPDQTSFEEAPLEASATPAAARAKLEFLLADLEADVMGASTRLEHVRLVMRVETLKDALKSLS